MTTIDAQHDETLNRRRTTPAVPPPRQSSVITGAWITIGAILAFAGLAWGTYSVISVLAHDEYTTTETFAAADVEALEIDNESGSISVIAVASDEVVVTANVSNGWHRTEVSSRLAGGLLQLTADCPPITDLWCSVGYTVEIPADRPVTINGTDGTVLVRGMAANVDVDNDNGALELEDVSGNIRASNDDGRIVGRRLTSAVVDASNSNGRIELSFTEPPQLVDATTANGRIDVVVPDDEVLYRVEMNTSHGGTDNLVRTDPNSDRVIDLSTRNGSITVRPPG